MGNFTKFIIEDAPPAWFGALGYLALHGPDIAAGELGAERSDSNYRDVALEHNRAAHQCPRQTQFTLGELG